LFRSGDFFEDLARRLGPEEGFGIGIVVFQVLHDGRFQLGDARGVVAIPNPYEFCATTWGSEFLTSLLVELREIRCINPARGRRGSLSSPHVALSAGEVERNQSNLVAHCRCFGAFVAWAALNCSARALENKA
jgi:hypothetical protein